MDHLIRRPDEILAFRPLQKILESKPKDLWIVSPADNVRVALRLMAEKKVGFLVVMERDRLAGVISERDFARWAARESKSADATSVADIMVRNVVTANPSHTFPECLKLMHQHGIRHLPVLYGGKVITVVSIRDLLGEAVTHHAKIIAELERERLTLFTSTV
jgi:CBS domain-containing protein